MPTFSALEYEGYSVPAFVPDVQHGHGKGRCYGTLGDCLIVQVALLGVSLSFRIANVLPKDSVFQYNGPDTAEDLDLHATRTFN